LTTLVYYYAREVFYCDLWLDNIFLNVNLNLFLYNFDNSKNNNYNRENLFNFGFFDSCIDFFDVIAKIEIFGLDSSIYTILIEYLSYESSILKIVQERSNYVYIFECLAFESKFSKIFEFIGGDIIKNC